MKKALLFIVVILSITSQAQTEWFPVGAKWYVNRHDAGSIYIPKDCDGYTYLEVLKDTIVLGFNSKVVSDRFFSCEGEETVYSNFIVREENQKVYHFENDTFNLMYDFNLGVGDTLDVSISNWDCDTVGEIIIDSISFLSVGGVQLKQQHLKLFIGNNGYTEYIITEKIGRTIFGDESSTEQKAIIFSPLANCTPGGYGFFPEDLRCYEDDVVSFVNDWKNWNDSETILPCDTIINTIVSTKNITTNSIKLFPNPASTYFQLNLEAKNNTITIRNLQGQIVYQEQIQDKNPIINIAHFYNGLYILNVMDTKGNSYSGKLIKN